MRGAVAMLFAIAATGCAATPVHVERPAPCSCAPTRTGELLTPLSAEAPEPTHRMTEDEAIESELVRHHLAMQVSKVPRPECTTLEPKVAPMIGVDARRGRWLAVLKGKL